MTNNEIGWKTEWLDHRIQFNGALYYEDWKDVQIGLFNPGLLGNLTFSSNGPGYHVKGIETEITGRVTRELRPADDQRLPAGRAGFRIAPRRLVLDD